MTDDVFLARVLGRAPRELAALDRRADAAAEALAVVIAELIESLHDLAVAAGRLDDVAARLDRWSRRPGAMLAVPLDDARGLLASGSSRVDGAVRLLDADRAFLAGSLAAVHARRVAADPSETP